MSTEPAHNRSRLADDPTLERITFRATDGQIDKLETLVDAGVFPNRSAALRAAVDELEPAEVRGESDGE